MNGIYLYFVNKHLSSWVRLGLQDKLKFGQYLLILLPCNTRLDVKRLKESNAFTDNISDIVQIVGIVC